MCLLLCKFSPGGSYTERTLREQRAIWADLPDGWGRGRPGLSSGRRRLQPPEGERLLFPAGNTSAKEETEMKESVSGDLDDFIFQDSWIISQR